MSRNASDYVEIFSEEYRIIERRHDQCSKMAERNYIQSTADNYRHLQNCLENGTPYPIILDTETNPSPTVPSDFSTNIQQNSLHKKEAVINLDLEMIETEPAHEIIKKIHNSVDTTSLYPTTTVVGATAAAYLNDDGGYNNNEAMNSMPITTVTAKTASQKIANLINKLLH